MICVLSDSLFTRRFSTEVSDGKGNLLNDAARSDVTTAEIRVGGVVDADAGRSAGVDELEAAGRGVDFGHNADVPNSVASTATAEENEVAFAHLGHTSYGAAFGVLAARGAGEREIILAIDVAGKTAAVEAMRATLPAAVRNTDVAESGGKEFLNDADAAAGILLGGGEHFGKAGCFGFAETRGGTDQFNESLGARFGETRLRGQRVSGGCGLIIGHILCIAGLGAAHMGGGKPTGEQRDSAKEEFFGFHEHLVL